MDMKKLEFLDIYPDPISGSEKGYISISYIQHLDIYPGYISNGYISYPFLFEVHMTRMYHTVPKYVLHIVYPGTREVVDLILDWRGTGGNYSKYFTFVKYSAQSEFLLVYLGRITTT